MDDATARIEIVEGDITRLGVDAVVNAANERLAPGGGVCGAIHAAAGPGLARECARLGPCDTGDAKTTGGYDLKARFVVHAVGPVWRGGTANEEALLASAYRRSLEVAREAGAQSIAFPAISTGIFGFPQDLAARIAVRTILDDLAVNAMPSRVVLACFSPQSANAHRKALAERIGS